MNILYLLIASLKWVGVMMLILLAIILFLITVILICPIKYNLNMEKKEMINLSANIKWLYSMVVLDIIYNSHNEVVRRLRVFGKTINFNQEKAAKQARNNPAGEKIISKKENHSQQNNKQNSQSNKVQKDKKPQGKSIGRKQKTNTIKETIAQIQAFEHKKDFVVDTLRWTKKFIRNIAPSSLEIDIEIGKEDPAETGQLMAILSALYPLYYPIANIVGNYEKECLYGKIKASGKLTIGRFGYDVIQYIRISSVKELTRAIRTNRKGKRYGRKAK